MFYAPVSFETIGFGDDPSLPHVRCDQWPRQRLRHLFVSIATVDKSGRRRLFLQGGARMFISQILQLPTTQILPSAQ
ncbi:hypothetical protein MUK42_08557 [Musa troglodytarum]|uniref:Uncharacterized protein n=1 Tax=Musa troglodytarum TaxID=320322 RepID=A0A9E7JKR7_9LILI|nr:hypothetical protein MUK42_08557 [Musa troglodytarum]